MLNALFTSDDELSDEDSRQQRALPSVMGQESRCSEQFSYTLASTWYNWVSKNQDLLRCENHIA